MSSFATAGTGWLETRQSSRPTRITHALSSGGTLGVTRFRAAAICWRDGRTDMQVSEEDVERAVIEAFRAVFKKWKREEK
jgi:hypothetical protein